MQNKITESDKLLDEEGKLKHCGYATSLILEYSRKDIKSSLLKIKEWDYYLVSNDKYAVALTIADNGYMGLSGVSVIDLEKGEEITKNYMSFMPKGRTNLPASSKNGDVILSTKKFVMEFKNDNGRRKLYFNCERFFKNKSLTVNIDIYEPEGDSIVMATPFFEDENAFYYNQKIVGMKAFGEVIFGEDNIIFDDSDTFALLDWGRGVWPYKNLWYWSSASCWHEGKVLSFNLGYGFGDTRAATENAVFLDGKIHKLDKVYFEIQKDKEGKFQYLKPWKITSNDKRIELVFNPVLDRKNYSSALIISSDQHQVFGKFSGKIVLDDGNVIEVKDMNRFEERVFNKW